MITANRQLARADEFALLIIATSTEWRARCMADIAQVETASGTAKTGSWANGERAITLAIRRQPDANTVATVDAIREVVPKMLAQIPSSVELKFRADRSQSIRDSIHDVKITLGITVALVVLVIFFSHATRWPRSFRRCRCPFLSSAPLAIVYGMGYTLDNISLLAITLAVGLVVDDAIVVLENIVRHMEEGKPPMQARAGGLARNGLHHRVHFALSGGGVHFRFFSCPA